MSSTRRAAARFSLTFATALTFVLAGAAAQTVPPPSAGDESGYRLLNPTKATDPAKAQPAPKRRSIVHHYPHPYPEYYHSDQTGGFRNPGGVGRYIEYYPPGNQFQETNDPVRPAQFDTGFGNRQEQMQALQVGVQRDNAIMNHIDRMARPSFGIGYFGGFY